MTAALPWSAPPPETVRAEPTGWKGTSDQPRARGAWRTPDPRAPGIAPLRGMPRSMPPRSLGQTLVNGGPAKTMRLDMQNVRLLRIRAESASETLRVAPPQSANREPMTGLASSWKPATIPEHSRKLNRCRGHAPCDRALRAPVQRTGPSTASDGPCSAGRPGLCRPRSNREDVRARTRPNHARPAFGHAPERTSGSRPSPSPPPCANPARKWP